MNRVRTHKFNKIKFQIDVEEPYIGMCDSPESERPTITLPRGLPHGNSKGAKQGLITLIHEVLHAESWNLPEEKVDRIATDMGSLLWRLNYRRVKK